MLSLHIVNPSCLVHGEQVCNMGVSAGAAACGSVRAAGWPQWHFWVFLLPCPLCSALLPAQALPAWEGSISSEVTHHTNNWGPWAWWYNIFIIKNKLSNKIQHSSLWSLFLQFSFSLFPPPPIILRLDNSLTGHKEEETFHFFKLKCKLSFVT